MNKVKSIKLIVSLFMMLTLFFTSTMAPIAAAVSDNLRVVRDEATISNGKVSLSVNASNGRIVLTDLENGTQFHSTPEDAGENGKIHASFKPRALSQVMIDVVDEEGVTSSHQSNMASIVVKTDGKKIVVEYSFDEVKIKLNVVYTLKGKSLIASIPLDSIKDNVKFTRETSTQIANKNNDVEKIVKCYSLTKVSLLPYFNAGNDLDEGFILVPDGSGAIINFNNGKGDRILYNQKVYGTDAIVNRKNMTANTQNVLLPVIGIHKEPTETKAGSNMLLYVEEGAAAAVVTANSSILNSQSNNSYNYGYFSFIYRSSAKVEMLENTEYAVAATMLANNKASCKNFTVSYNILAPEGDYNEMAVATREKLIKDGLKSDKITDKVYIEAYMSVNKTMHFLGIPYNATQVLTSFNECLKLIKKVDGNAVMILNGVDKYGAVGGTIDTEFAVQSGLGGVKKYKSFVKAAKKLNTEVFPVSEFVLYDKSQWGYTTFWDNARSVDIKPMEKAYFLYGNYQENKDYSKLRYLLPTKIVSAANSYIKSLKKNGIKNAAPLSIGNSPYSSRDGEGCDVVSTAANYETVLKKMKSNGIKVALQSPAAYALNYTNYAYGMPLRSSNYNIFDYDIPFVQLVLNGVKNYSTPAINLTNNIEEMELLMIESGSSPAYAITGKEYKEVKDTPLDVLYGAHLSSIKSNIVKGVKEYRNFYAKTGCKIARHTTISKTLRMVEYENGTKILINYDDKKAGYGGITVEKMSYVFIEGGVSVE